ncbi:MAG: leucine-rich repeat domain-containing protein [Verrucomicrobia bacterium]|nr:leucine-rich repeat domain-containing protein [Verrucomicrobiota bacterium]MCH8514569.1 leucine-rich repeat domain-containing protein [Kiritimatiellia bacterium]
MSKRLSILILLQFTISSNTHSASANADDFRFEISEEQTLTITGYRGPGGEVVIPSEIEGKPVTAVGHRAFMDHVQGNHDRMITSIRFPETVTSVGREAFRENRQLTDVFIPASLTEITRPAFSRCPRLMNFHIHEDNPAYRSVDGVFFTRDMEEIRHYPQGREGDYVIPQGVIRIRDEAFRWATGLTEITIPDSVTWIGKQAFRGCEGLTEITLPKHLETLARQGRHFMDCVNLKKIVIPDGVTDIPQHAFSGCTSLEEVVLPENLASIQQSAFQDCSSLTQITIPANVRQIRGGQVFAGCDKLERIVFLGDAPEVSGRDHFPEGVTIFRKASASGWPEPGEDWQGRPTVITSP